MSGCRATTKRAGDDSTTTCSPALRALPQVANATWGFPVPFDTYGRGVTLYVDGISTASKDGTFGVDASFMAEDFIGALGLRLQGGREFTTSDSAARRV